MGATNIDKLVADLDKVLSGRAGYWELQHLDEEDSFNVWKYDQQLQCFITNSLYHRRRICDFGCGNGELVRFLKTRLPDARFQGYDWSETAVAEARRRRVNAKKVDLNGEKPFGNDRFDAIAAITSFEYTDIDKSIKEIHHALNAGGIFVAVIHRLNSFVLKKYHNFARKDERVKDFLPQFEENLKRLEPPRQYQFLESNGFDVELSQNFQIPRKGRGRKKAYRMLVHGVVARKI